MKYQFIEDNRSEFTVKKMCHVLKISVAGYHHLKNRELSSQAIQNEAVKKSDY